MLMGLFGPIFKYSWYDNIQDFKSSMLTIIKI